jgi:hypothetical protein
VTDATSGRRQAAGFYSVKAFISGSRTFHSIDRDCSVGTVRKGTIVQVPSYMLLSEIWTLH